MILAGYVHKGVLSQTPHHMQPTELLPQYYALPYQTPDRTMPRDTKKRNGQQGIRKESKKLIESNSLAHSTARFVSRQSHHIAFIACATRIGTNIAVTKPMLTTRPAISAARFEFDVQWPKSPFVTDMMMESPHIL